MKKRLSALVLCAALLSTSLPAQAAQYPDLPLTHWAFAELDRAVELGVITGIGNGYIAPEKTLTWAEYLTMLGRAFFPDTLATALADGLTWDQAAYAASLEYGLLGEGDFLDVDETSLSQPILREDAAVLLSRVIPQDSENVWPYAPGTTAAASFSDWASLDNARQAAVESLFQLSVIQGRDDGTFSGGDTIRRADGCVLLMRTMDAVDYLRTGEYKTVTLHIVDRDGKSLGPDQVVSARIGSWAEDAVDTNLLWHYACASDIPIGAFQDEYTLVYRPFTKEEAGETDVYQSTVVNVGTGIYAMGENSEKRYLLYGSTTQRRYSSQSEAERHMTTVSIPVWRLDKNGNKYASTSSISVNANIANEVVAIFTEIFNDPEQFPFHGIGGYGWRGDSATGEHNCGTAIDLNVNENYQIRNGKVLVGSFWDPDASPYSIGVNSSVVRIFAAHGWSWGGNAWAKDADPSTGYHDYMHFSYMGW